MSGFDMKDRVVVDLSETLEKVTRFADEMNAMCRNSDVKAILSADDQREIADAIENLQKHAKDKLTVVVSGSFKRGKSTFINALLGENAAPTNVTPETITINKIVYGEEVGAEAVLKDGMRLKLYDEEITREKLESILSQVPSPVDHLEIRRNIPILRELTFIDTPGLDDTEDFSDAIMDAMLRADIIVYIVSALSPLSAEEQTFLNSVVLPQNFSKMFLVINMADVLDGEDDIGRIKAEITRRAYAFNNNASVYIVSALDEYCKKTNEERPSPDAAERLQTYFEEFETALTNDVILQKELVKAQRITTIEQQIIKMLRFKVGAVLNMLDMSEQNLEETERKLYEEKVNIDRVLANTKSTVSDFIMSKKDEARIWMDDFMKRLRAELEGAKTGATGQQIQKHVHFYLSDKVKEAFMSCIEEHAGQMRDMLEDEVEEFNDIELSGEGYTGIHIRLKDVSWTTVNSAFYLGEEIAYELGFGIGGFGGLLIEALGGFLRQKQISKSQNDVISPILNDFGKLTSEVFAQLDDVYNSYAEEAQKSIEDYFRKSIDEALETIRHAKQVNNEFSEKKAETKRLLEEINNTLDMLEANI